MRVPTQAKSQAFMDVVTMLIAAGYGVKSTGRREESIYSDDAAPIPLGKLTQEDDGQPYIHYRFPSGSGVRIGSGYDLLRHLKVASRTLTFGDNAWLYAALVMSFPDIRLIRGQLRLNGMRIVRIYSGGYCVNAHGQSYTFSELSALRINLQRGMDTAFTTYAG